MEPSSGNGPDVAALAIDLVKCLWWNKAYIALTFLAVQLVLFMRRALRDGYFDAIPKLQVYTGKGEPALAFHA